MIKSKKVIDLSKKKSNRTKKVNFKKSTLFDISKNINSTEIMKIKDTEDIPMDSRDKLEKKKSGMKIQEVLIEEPGFDNINKVNIVRKKAKKPIHKKRLDRSFDSLNSANNLIRQNIVKKIFLNENDEFEIATSKQIHDYKRRLNDDVKRHSKIDFNYDDYFSVKELIDFENMIFEEKSKAKEEQKKIDRINQLNEKFEGTVLSLEDSEKQKFKNENEFIDYLTKKNLTDYEIKTEVEKFLIRQKLEESIELKKYYEKTADELKKEKKKWEGEINAQKEKARKNLAAERQQLKKDFLSNKKKDNTWIYDTTKNSIDPYMEVKEVIDKDEPFPNAKIVGKNSAKLNLDIEALKKERALEKKEQRHIKREKLYKEKMLENEIVEARKKEMNKRFKELERKKIDLKNYYIGLKKDIIDREILMKQKEQELVEKARETETKILELNQKLESKIGKMKEQTGLINLIREDSVKKENPNIFDTLKIQENLNEVREANRKAIIEETNYITKLINKEDKK